MEKSKQRVLACSFKMFAEHGIESVTMPDLAKASDIDRSSIYRYFPTKADLVIAISSNVWENITTQEYVLLRSLPYGCALAGIMPMMSREQNTICRLTRNLALTVSRSWAFPTLT